MAIGLETDSDRSDMTCRDPGPGGDCQLVLTCDFWKHFMLGAGRTSEMYRVGLPRRGAQSSVRGCCP